MCQQATQEPESWVPFKVGFQHTIAPKEIEVALISHTIQGGDPGRTFNISY